MHPAKRIIAHAMVHPQIHAEQQKRTNHDWNLAKVIVATD